MLSFQFNYWDLIKTTRMFANKQHQKHLFRKALNIPLYVRGSERGLEQIDNKIVISKIYTPYKAIARLSHTACFGINWAHKSRGGKFSLRVALEFSAQSKPRSR